MALNNFIDTKKPPNNSANKEPAQIFQNSGGTVPISSITTFAGPTPPPQFLEHYEHIVAGSAKRFLEEPHLEAEHRRALEKLMVEEQINLSKRGQWMAFTLAIICILGALTAIFYGYDLAGLGTLFIAVSGLVGVFIYAKHQNKG